MKNIFKNISIKLAVTICFGMLVHINLTAQLNPCGAGVGTVLFYETFDEADGATSGADANGINWTASCPGCVAGDRFEVDTWMGVTGLRGNDTNGPGTFTAPGLDISSCEVVVFSFDYESDGYNGSGNLECVDECTGCSGVPSEGVSNGGCNNCWDFLYGEIAWASGSNQQIILGDDCNVSDGGSISNAICGSLDADGNEIPAAELTNVDINIVMAMWAGTEDMIIDNVALICYTAAEVSACADANVSGACPVSCPDLTAAAPAAVVTNSTCNSSCMLEGGSIEAPATACPDGSTIQYSIDNGTNWSPMIPAYPAANTTILTRCNCDVDITMSSPTGSVMATPGTCVIPAAPTAANTNFCADDAIVDVCATGLADAVFNWYSDAALTTLVQAKNACYTPTGNTETVYVTQTVNGCESLGTTVVITWYSEIVVAAQTVCVNNGTDAAFGEYFVEITSISGGTSPYSVDLSSFNAGGGSTITATAAGIYGPFTHLGNMNVITILATDDNDCTASIEVNESVCGFDPTGDDDGVADAIEDESLHHSGFICSCENAPTPVAMLAQTNPNNYTAGGTSGFSQWYVLVDIMGNYITHNMTGYFNGGMTLPITGMTEGIYTIVAVNGVSTQIDPIITGLTLGDNVTAALAAVPGCFDSTCNITYDIDCGCCRPNAGVLSTDDCTSLCSNLISGTSSGNDIVCIDVDFSTKQDRDPAPGYEYVFVVTDANGIVLSLLNPASQYDQNSDPGTMVNCEPLVIPAMAPGTYDIYGINYNPNMMIFNGLPAVGDDINMWAMGIQEMDNCNSLTNPIMSGANSGMTVIENGYMLDCADITYTGFLEFTVLEPVDFQPSTSCTSDGTNPAGVGQWYALIENVSGGAPTYTVCDNKGTTPVAVSGTETFIGPYSSDLNVLELTVKDNNSSNSPCINCETTLIIQGPVFPSPGVPEANICINMIVAAMNEYDLTQHDVMVLNGATGTVAWFVGQASNGGVAVANPAAADFSLFTNASTTDDPEIWATLTDASGCASEIQLTVNVNSADCGTVPAWDGSNEEE